MRTSLVSVVTAVVLFAAPGSAMYCVGLCEPAQPADLGCHHENATSTPLRVSSDSTCLDALNGQAPFLHKSEAKTLVAGRLMVVLQSAAPAHRPPTSAFALAGRCERPRRAGYPPVSLPLRI